MKHGVWGTHGMSSGTVGPKVKMKKKKKPLVFFFFNLECTNVCVYVYYMLTETNDGILRQGEPCNMETYHTLTLVLKSLKLNTYLYLSTYICFLCISSDLHQQ